jgi:hypothetical protein
MKTAEKHGQWDMAFAVKRVVFAIEALGIVEAPAIKRNVRILGLSPEDSGRRN